MSRRKPSTSQLAIVDRNGAADGRQITKKDRKLSFGERWTYAPAPEARNYIKLRDRYQLFINGRFVAPKSGEYFDSINPATEEKLAEIGSANEKDVDLAVKAARRAYRNVWSKMPGRERGKYLFRIARLIQEKARELAVLETMDGGKTIKESRDIDLPLVAAHFFYYAGWADKLEYAFPGRSTRPLGVAGQIIPWNFPLLMAAWKLAPALAAGNTCVLKPAETTSITAIHLAEILQAAELRDRISTLRVGNPLDKNTDIGAINSRMQLDKICELVDSGVQQGAQLVQPALRLPAKGYWYPPSFFTGVTASHRIAQEEIFGPVLSVMTFRTPEEAIERANNTPYGLSAGVWTDKGSKIFKIVNKLRAGVVWANTYNKFDPTSPFGGYKESGFGREGGRHGLLPYVVLS